jgi:hypothetical protein
MNKNIETGYIPTMDITVIFDFSDIEVGKIVGFYYGTPDSKVTQEVLAQGSL